MVLWLADIPGWAYASIVLQMARQLPQYRHHMHYCCYGPQDGISLVMLQQEADIIVSMYLLYQRGLQDRHLPKTVTMLTGFRPFEVAS